VEHASQSPRLKLLLIDDSDAELNFYRFALEPEFTIVTAARGAEGVTMASLSRPDAIVLDVMMPGMDGWEACTRLKCNDDTAEIPVILLTGANDRDLSQHANAVGASAVLRKPCSVDKLRQTIVAALSHP
jgi:CheY-like chemotaxis protein